MKNTDLEKLRIISRIQLLKSRTGKENDPIIKKLERKLKNFEKNS